MHSRIYVVAPHNRKKVARLSAVAINVSRERIVLSKRRSDFKTSQLSIRLARHFCRPMLLLFLQLPLDIPNRNQNPNAGPNKRHTPTDYIRLIVLEREDENGAQDGDEVRSHGPEQAQPTQHGAENVTGFVALVECFAEVGAATAINSDDVFDEAVYAGSELGAFGDRREAYGGGNSKVTQYVDDEEFDAESVEH